jgi:hypothetical protein
MELEHKQRELEKRAQELERLKQEQLVSTKSLSLFFHLLIHTHTLPYSFTDSLTRDIYAL